MAYLQINGFSIAQRSDDNEIAADWQAAANWLKWFADKADWRAGIKVTCETVTESIPIEELAPENRTLTTWVTCEATKHSQTETLGNVKEGQI